jgi:hypothetical protein
MIVTLDNIDSIVTDFRDEQDEFSDVNLYPDKVIKKCLFRSNQEIGARWGSFKLGDPTSFARQGLFLFASHWLVINYRGSAASSANIKQGAQLNVASKSVGDESVNYRITAMQDTEDDWLSVTNYGVQFLRLRSMIIGGVSVGSMP